MAIYSAVPPPPDQASPPPPPPRARTPPSLAQQRQQTPRRDSPAAAFTPPTVRQPLDIDAWTINALEALSVSPIARGTRSPLTIRLDDHEDPEHARARAEKAERKALRTRVTAAEEEGSDGKARATSSEHAGEHAGLGQAIKRPLSRRDSQRKREMLLKGKEGSRQRRRWENDRLMHVPNAQPPLPSDYQPHPTHPVQHTPYALATYWDASLAKLSLKRATTTQAARKTAQRQRGTATGVCAGEVPRDLREQVKRSEVVRSWVRALEEPIRGYMSQAAPVRLPVERAGSSDEDDEDDDEIVFSGRGATAPAAKSADWKMARREVQNRTVDSGMVLDSFGDEDGSAFKRWLTHSISHYYGLESRSVMIPNPSRKVVYVGCKQGAHLASRLPRPLWEVC